MKVTLVGRMQSQKFQIGPDVNDSRTEKLLQIFRIARSKLIET